VTGQMLDIPQNFDSARLLSILGGREETIIGPQVILWAM
jgi:hypothetical protein